VWRHSCALLCSFELCASAMSAGLRFGSNQHTTVLASMLCLMFRTRFFCTLQVKEMLMPFGQLKAFNLVMDRGTGNSKVCRWWWQCACVVPWRDASYAICGTAGCLQHVCPRDCCC
jgi:hypothetical protein